MKNIAFISPGKLPLPAIKGGAVEGLIDLLTDYLDESKYTITIYSVSDYEHIVKNRNKTYVYVCNTGFINQFKRKTLGVLNFVQSRYIGNNYINKICNRIKKSEEIFDCIIVENVPEYGLLLKQCSNAKMVLHMHNNEFNNNAKNAEKIYDVYDEIYAISNTVKKNISTIKNTQKNKLLYNGVDSAAFNKKITNEQRRQLRNAINIKDSDIVFVFAGRLVEEKGVKELINAFRRILKKHKNVKLLIIGSSFFEGAKESQYVKELKKIAVGIENNIIFTGYINHSELYKWYNIADVGVVPSQWEEPFALTVIEEMMCGLPMIASECGGIKEITDSNCTLLIPIGDNYVNMLENAMDTLVKEHETRKKMSENSLLQAKKFDSSIYCNQFNKYIEDLLNRKGI